MNIATIDSTRDQLATPGTTGWTAHSPDQAAGKAAANVQGQAKVNNSESADNTEKLLKKTQEHFQAMGVNFQFKLNTSAGDMQVEVMDQKTKQIIMKIPQDELSSLADNVNSMAKGVTHRSI